MTKLSGKTNLYDYDVTMFGKKTHQNSHTNLTNVMTQALNLYSVYFTHNLRIWQLLHLFAMYLHTIDVRRCRKYSLIVNSNRIESVIDWFTFYVF